MKVNLLKNLALAAALAAGAGAAHAEYATIYWNVSPSQTEAFGYSYASVTYAPTAGGLGVSYLDFYDSGAMTEPTVIQAGITDKLPEEGKSYADYSFRIDLFGEGGDLVAVSKVESMNSLKTDWHAVLADTSQTGHGIWTPTVFTAVPEPTSGMLFLLGLASLALRRRRV